MNIGIYGIASQSGHAFFADFLSRGYKVIGYNRPSPHGNMVLRAIEEAKGIYLERPENANHEESRFIPLGKSFVTSDLEKMVSSVDIVIVALPSIYHEEAIKAMCDVGILKSRVPIILSPSRSVSSPYMWRITGERYPIICFSTCPYSCKTLKPGVALIKRRKRTFVASLEGEVTFPHVRMMSELFPQTALTRIPALTSLNNIGAVFHCATYMLNIDEIERRKSNGEVYSFYMEGIAARPEVGLVLEQIDQVRLQIAHSLGIQTFGLKEKPREDTWSKLTNALRAFEEENSSNIDSLRHIRKKFTEFLDNSVPSAQHWLDITYGVVRQEGESLSSAIGRTPTYYSNSVPQLRYVTEDIPTGLVVYEALAKMLGIDCSVCTEIIDLYDERFNEDVREKGRDLKGFDKDFIKDYLLGKI